MRDSFAYPHTPHTPHTYSFVQCSNVFKCIHNNVRSGFVSSDEELSKYKQHFSGRQRILRGVRRTVDLRTIGGYSLDVWSTLSDTERSRYADSLQKNLLPSALSLASNRVLANKDQLPFIRHTNRRDMDRSRRKLCERSAKIGPVRVIASLHLTSPRIKGPIPKYAGDPPLPPLRDSNDDDGEGEDQDFIDDLIQKAAERRKAFVGDMAPSATFGIPY